MVWNIVCDSSCDLRATDVKNPSNLKPYHCASR